MTNRIILDATSQTLTHVPMGVASSPTFVLEDLTYDPDQTADRQLASGSATAASWSLTTDAEAGPTQQQGARISVTSTTDAAVGAPALIVAPDGTRELFHIRGLATDDYLEAAGPLAGVYPSGSTVYGVLLTANVPDSVAADEELFEQHHALRVTWSYSLDGVARKIPELVEFVRHDTAGDELAAEAVLWIAKTYPDLRPRLPVGADIDTIATAMAEEVANDLRAREIAPETFLAADRRRQLLTQRILAHAGDLGWAPGDQDPGPWAERALRRYDRLLASLTIGRPGHATAETHKTTDTSPGTPSRRPRGLFHSM
jgi:hypothetical protein